MLLRRSTLYVLACTVAVSGALTLFYIQADGPLLATPSLLPDLNTPLREEGHPPHSGSSKTGLGETDTEFGILPIDLGSPVDPDEMVEGSDGISFIPDRPEGVQLDLPPPTDDSTTTTDPAAKEDIAEILPPPPTEVSPKPPSIPADFKYKLSSPLLSTRLSEFLHRPILSYAAALKENVKTCPLKIHDRQVNPDQLKGERDFWKSVSETDVKARREGLVKALEQAEKNGEKIVSSENEKSGGRGIVVAGGNRDTTARILTLLRILRNHHKSTLPVQIFHFPGEITSEGEREEIATLGGELVQFEGVQQLNIWKNFQIKALSILKSKFDEVLYLDSDNIPLQDPEALFKDSGYLKNGKAVFWPDINKDHPENAIFRLLGETCDHDEWQIDSGQILIDKRGNDGLNLAALHLAGLMQTDHEFWFKLSGGDKDTFRYAFHILGIPFFASPRWLSSAGSLNSMEDNRFCGNTMLQYDLTSNPRPLFLHANLLKHTSGVRRGSTFTHIKTLAAPHASKNDPALDGARMWVYTGRGRGMCVDLEVEGKEEAVVYTWEEGGGLKGLEALFYDNGGKAGGW